VDVFGGEDEVPLLVGERGEEKGEEEEVGKEGEEEMNAK